jgi:hypothetical protein
MLQFVGAIGLQGIVSAFGLDVFGIGIRGEHG